MAGCTKAPVYSNPSYAVGTVISFDAGILRRSGTTYFFYVNGRRYEGSSRKVPINKKLAEGEKYMVAYEAAQIDKNIMIFADKVVNDSVDSATYVSQYIFHPPF
ncbi:hypothetical protein GCM10023093_25690 [Nemorincola caseinilytica]|uniref:Uncharacterized protein n=2 Tax=Nemorincola caseinilytica TaxID=2054315 RepID=A0ABP8NML1_9BACT